MKLNNIFNWASVKVYCSMESENNNQKAVEDFRKTFLSLLNCMRGGDNVRAADGEEIKSGSNNFMFQKLK